MFGGWWKIAIAATLLGICVTLETTHGAISIVSILGLSAFVLYLIIAGVAWLRQSKALDEWLRQQEGAPVIYSLSDEAVETTARISSAKLKWDAFHRLSISDFDTLLLFSFHGALTLPTDQVPVEALEFLKKRFLAYGKKVEDRRTKA